MHQSTPPSLSQTIWQRWASTQFLTPPYSPDRAYLDFWLFPKLRGCRYETIEEMKDAVTKVIDTLTQEDLHGAFKKLLERYNKCRGVYLEGDYRFMSVLSMKVPIRKKSGHLFKAPCKILKNRLWVYKVLFSLLKLYYVKYINIYVSNASLLITLI